MASSSGIAWALARAPRALPPATILRGRWLVIVLERAVEEMSVPQGARLRCAKIRADKVARFLLAVRPGPRVPGLDNLYLAGDWVGSEGFLVDASMASAHRAAELVLEDGWPSLRKVATS